MFYDPGTGQHGLRHDPFKALVSPRPIGWISTAGRDGVANLAPYSFFNAFSTNPHIVGFASQGRKDSQINAEETGAFCCNLVVGPLADAMNLSAAPLPAGVDEFSHAGLEKGQGLSVDVPYVKASPAVLECRYLQTIALKDLDGADAGSALVLGQVTGIHIDDAFISDGVVRTTDLQLLSRLGYQDYAQVDAVFSLRRPEKA